MGSESTMCANKFADTQTITMKHLAAYLLLGLGGNSSPSAADVKGVLEAVGIDADEERLDQLIKELKGKDLSEVRVPVERLRLQRPFDLMLMCCNYS
jgi:hypothetical protein